MRRLYNSLLLLLFIRSNLIGDMPDQKERNVKVASRIKLMTDVQIMSVYDKQFNLIIRFEFLYRKDMISYFSPFKAYKVVKNY